MHTLETYATAPCTKGSILRMAELELHLMLIEGGIPDVEAVRQQWT